MAKKPLGDALFDEPSLSDAQKIVKARFEEVDQEMDRLDRLSQTISDHISASQSKSNDGIDSK